MKSGRYFVILGLSLGLAACQSNQTGAGSSNSQATAIGATNHSVTNSAPAANKSGSNNDSDGPIAPDWANYTYLCDAFTGPDHVMQAINAKRQVMGIAGMKDWYVIHSESESDLFYGYYKSWNDPTDAKEYARAQGDHSKLTRLADSSGQPIFQQVLPQPLALPDPPAPQEWDVFNNPGYWTLLICKYQDNPQRKQAAVDSVKNLRANGYAAYYHHFLGESEVYVGEFPRQAVKEQQSDVAKSTKGKELLVLTQEVPGLDKNPPLGKDGKPVTVIMPKLEMVDPKLIHLATVDFPNTAINGHVMATPMKMQDGSIQAVPYPSYLVQVPHTENTDLVDPLDPYVGNNAQSTNGATTPAPVAASPPIGDAQPAPAPGDASSNAGNQQPANGSAQQPAPALPQMPVGLPGMQ